MAECPSSSALHQLLGGAREPDKDWDEHLSSCPDCQARLEELFAAAAESGLLRSGGKPLRSPALESALQTLEAERPQSVGATSESRQRSFPFLEPSDRPDALGKVAHYDVLRLLGRGGMGLVFLAEDTRLKRPVALKALAPLTALSDDSRGRFLREAQTAAGLNHENIVQVYGVEQAGDVPCLVLQYVPGESLADRLSRVGRLPLPELFDLGRDVARGLAAAHAERVIHRDIKPANILLDERTGRALIADFGLAKPLDEAALTSSGLIVGTPEFIAPEQLDGGAVDERSDLFSLGATLYYAATGVSPFRAASPWAALERVRRHEPAAANTINPDLPEWLSDLLVRLLEKDPKVRLASAAIVVERFAAAGPPTIVERASAATHGDLERPRGPRRKRLLATLGLLAVLPLAIIGWRLRPQVPPLAASPGAFFVAGRAEPLATLAEAIEQAADGATIEIRGDGPFRSPPLSVGAKRLTLRAAEDARPMIIMESPGQPSERPWLQTEADLTLEGLDVRWMTAPGRGGRGDAELLGRSVVAATGGRLQLTHCRIVAGRMNCCVGSAAEVRLADCHLAAENGVGLFWRPRAGARCEVVDSAIDCWLGLTSMTSAAIVSPTPAKLVLTRNTFRGARGLQLVLEPPPRQSLQVEATANLFAVDHLTVMVPLRRPRRPEASLTTEQAIAQLRSCLSAWQGRDNVYLRTVEFIGYVPAPMPPLSAGISDLFRWAEVWDAPREASIQGTPRFAAPIAGVIAPPRLERIDDPTGPLPVAGAAAELVGPR